MDAYKKAHGGDLRLKLGLPSFTDSGGGTQRRGVPLRSRIRHVIPMLVFRETTRGDHHSNSGVGGDPREIEGTPIRQQAGQDTPQVPLRTFIQMAGDNPPTRDLRGPKKRPQGNSSPGAHCNQKFGHQ